MNLPPVDAGAKTATEYQIRANEALEQQNAAFTRLQKELIEKTVARVHSILSRYDLVGSHKVNNKEVSVKATSPLSMYQDNKDIQDVNNYIITTMQTLGESVGANVLRTTLDIEKYGSYTADKMGIPTDIRLSPEKRSEVLEQIQQEAIAQQQQQQAEAQAQQAPPQQLPPQ